MGVLVLVNFNLEASKGWRCDCASNLWVTAEAVSSAVLTPSGGVVEIAEGAIVFEGTEVKLSN